MKLYFEVLIIKTLIIGEQRKTARLQRQHWGSANRVPRIEVIISEIIRSIMVI
jgi:hypothetical protein